MILSRNFKISMILRDHFSKKRDFILVEKQAETQNSEQNSDGSIIFNHFTNKTAIKATFQAENCAYFGDLQKASCSPLLLKLLKNVAFRADPVPLHWARVFSNNRNNIAHINICSNISHKDGFFMHISANDSRTGPIGPTIIGPTGPKWRVGRTCNMLPRSGSQLLGRSFWVAPTPWLVALKGQVGPT